MAATRIAGIDDAWTTTYTHIDCYGWDYASQRLFLFCARMLAICVRSFA
jgi:hypothetical protein